MWKTAILACLMLALPIDGPGPARAQALPTALPTRTRPAATAPGGAAPLLGLAELEQMALNNNPTLGQAISRVDQARGRAVQAGLYPNPYLVYTDSNAGVAGTAGQEYSFFQQPIVTGGKLRINRQRYEAEVEEARWIVQEQQYRVLNGVRLRYCDLLAIQELLDLRRDIIRLAEDVERAVQEKVRSGHASEPDLLMAQYTAEHHRLAEEELGDRYPGAWHNLAAFVGCPDLTPTALSGRLEDGPTELSFESVQDHLLRASPEIRIAELKVRGQELSLRREQVEPIPDLIVRGGGGYNAIRQSGFGYGRLYVELPLWNRNQGNIRTAEAALFDIRRDLDRTRLALLQRLARSFAHYQASLHIMRRYRDKLLPASRRAFELYLRGLSPREIPVQPRGEGDGVLHRFGRALPVGPARGAPA